MINILKALYFYYFPRTSQQIFNLVISNGYYTRKSVNGSFMCISLDSAKEDDIISYAECKRAQKEIMTYISYYGIRAYLANLKIVSPSTKLV
jgi:hypothetical protein